MNGRGRAFGAIVLMIGLVLGALLVGVLAYNAGVAQGVVQSADAVLPAGEVESMASNPQNRGRPKTTRSDCAPQIEQARDFAPFLSQLNLRRGAALIQRDAPRSKMDFI